MRNVIHDSSGGYNRAILFPLAANEARRVSPSESRVVGTTDKAAIFQKTEGRKAEIGIDGIDFRARPSRVHGGKGPQKRSGRRYLLIVLLESSK